MTPSARLQAVIDILTALDNEARPMDALTSAYFRARRFIGSTDRGVISETAYAIVRHHARMTWWLEKINVEITPRTVALIFMRLVEGKQENEVKTLFGDGRFAPDNLTPDEEKLIGKLKGRTLFHPDMPDEVALECPPFAAESLKARFGKKFKTEMEELLKPAPLDLRINPLKITREAALAILKRDEIPSKPCPLSPWGIRVPKRMALDKIPLLKMGSLEIQDEGSQVISLLVGAKPGERVVDFCAGAGGKTLVLAAAMENKGRVIACDIMEKRLKRSAERFRRAELFNIETRPLTDERDAWVKKHKGMFDRVLVDAPCSGVGTWRRNPDTKWRILGPSLDVLVPLQQSILTSAARLVKGGGRLVYATCSMLREENEAQIEKFLEDNKDFKLVPVREISEAVLGKVFDADMLSLTPGTDGTDGFFAAVMERIATPKAEKPETPTTD